MNEFSIINFKCLPPVPIKHKANLYSRHIILHSTKHLGYLNKSYTLFNYLLPYIISEADISAISVAPMSQFLVSGVLLPLLYGNGKREVGVACYGLAVLKLVTWLKK
jgi:hypothetical protein